MGIFRYEIGSTAPAPHYLLVSASALIREMVNTYVNRLNSYNLQQYPTELVYPRINVLLSGEILLGDNLSIISFLGWDTGSCSHKVFHRHIGNAHQRRR